MTDPALLHAAREMLKDYILLGREELAEKIAAFGAAQYAAGVARFRAALHMRLMSEFGWSLTETDEFVADVVADMTREPVAR